MVSASSGATDLIFKVELTRGPGGDSPALDVMETVERHPAGAEKFARLWLIAYQRANPGSGASGYRILDQHGKCLKASVI